MFQIFSVNLDKCNTSYTNDAYNADRDKRTHVEDGGGDSPAELGGGPVHRREQLLRALPRGRRHGHNLNTTEMGRVKK